MGSVHGWRERGIYKADEAGGLRDRRRPGACVAATAEGTHSRRFQACGDHDRREGRGKGGRTDQGDAGSDAG